MDTLALLNLSYAHTQNVLAELLRRATALRDSIHEIDPQAVPPEAMASTNPVIVRDLITWESPARDANGHPDWYYTIPMDYLFDIQLVAAKLQDVQRQRARRERLAEQRAEYDRRAAAGIAHGQQIADRIAAEENDRRAASHIEPGRPFVTGTSAAHTKEGTA